MKLKALLYQNPIGYLSLFILLLFAVALLFFDTRASVCAFLIFIVLFLACVFYSAHSASLTRKYVAEINKSLKLEETDEVGSFPLPGVICDLYGNIVWYNTLFEKELLAGHENGKLNMSMFFRDYSYKAFSKLDSVSTSCGDRLYTAFITKIKNESTPLLSLYFLDDTYYKTTEAEYRQSRPFVMFMMVDNIETLSRQLSDSRFALVTSGIEGLIEQWIKDENLIFKKTASGRFLIIGEQRSLDSLCRGKFSVLGRVRNYKYNNVEVDSTLSIGVGSGSHFQECEDRAKKALDMALGRGGDQAAVYSDSGYVYYGGVSGSSPDNSRVSPRRTASNIFGLIKKYDKVLILGHKFSDYDCIGAGLGVLYMAQSCGVESRLVVSRKKTLAGPLVELIEKSGYDLFIEPEDALRFCDQKTLLFVLDTHVATLTECPELCEKATAKVVIDHHRRMENFISDAAIFYHLPGPSSTCEMVAELIEYSAIQEKMPDIIATALLSGIVLDTKDFVLRTSRRTFEAAAYLRQCGANTVAVRKLFSVGGKDIALKNEIVASGEMHRECMIALSESDAKEMRIVSSKAADEMLNVEGVKASFVLYNAGSCVNISARSLGEENVQLIMEKLGGGGHMTMAASQIEGATLDEAKEKLVAAIDAYYEAKS